MENGWTPPLWHLLLTKNMGDTDTLTQNVTKMAADLPWNVVVHDDPVNLMRYVTLVLKKLFHYDEAHATQLMMQVHQAGRAIVWTGQREKAEFYVQQLQAHQLKSSLEKSR